MTTVPILCYHAVAEGIDGEDRPFALTPSHFEAHLDVIASEGRRALTVADLVRARRANGVPDDGVVLTFDDGFADVLRVVAPALAARGLTGTAFLTTGRLREAPAEHPGAALSWDEAAELAHSGMEVGAHGHRHLEMDLCGLAAARDELRRSKELLEARIGCPVTTFAYPYGYSTREVRTEAAAAGYEAACGVKHALSSGEDDPFALARLRVTRRTSADTLRGWLAGEGVRVAPCSERLVTRGWRVVRRVRRLV
jgi:peptidoglycan/xylan/chitin deacetylase (PgdA/CDA1 family)